MKIIKFGAVWCPGCLVMKPRFKKIEAANPELETEYYDYDMDEDQVEKWNIGTQIPAFIFVDKDEKEITRLIGEQSENKILELIEEHKEK